MNITKTTEKYPPISLVVNCSDAIAKSFWVVLDGKLCALYDLLGIKAGELIDKIIKRGTEVVDNLANQDGENQGQWVGGDCDGTKYSISFSTIFHRQLYTLAIDGNTINLIFAENVNPLPQVCQVFLCPTNPLVSAIQRMHMLYFPCGGRLRTE